MSNDFLVHPREIALVDESDFVAHGGTNLHFGAVCDGAVHLYAAGSHEAIAHLALQIKFHGTAA